MTRLTVVANRPVLLTGNQAQAQWVADQLAAKEKRSLLHRRPAWLVPAVIVACGVVLALAGR